jgi:very-short-patch-repair endonuclease
MTTRRTGLARGLRKRSTSTEEFLWEQLRNRRLDGRKFRRQMPVAGFVADFCCYEVRVTIELDGRGHADREAYDGERRAKIEKEGFVEIRFTNDEVKERPDWVVGEIRRVLDIARARAPRSPFPRLD